MLEMPRSACQPCSARRANTAQVNFRKEGGNGTHKPYANIQTLDSRFVKERFNEPATLWESVGHGANGFANLDDCDEWDAWECEEGCNEPTDGLLKSLHAAAGGCSGGFKPSELWAKLDKNSLFAMAAVDRIINNGDSWCGRNGLSGRNYLLAYGHASGKFQLIPWGTDMTFQMNWWGYSKPGQSGKEWYSCGLMKDCLKNQECEDDYDAAYSQAVDTIRASRQELLDHIALANSQADEKGSLSPVRPAITKVIEEL